MSKVSLSAGSPVEVLIVGGGVIGLSIARELALRGVGNVAVIERGDFGREASWAAGGILGPQAEANCADDFFKLTCASRDLYPAFVDALAEQTGIDVELDRTGTLYAGFTEDDERELRRRHEWQKQSGLRVDWLNDDDARRLEANISQNIRCALLFPDDWQVENRKLIEALIASNKKLDVQLMANCDARSMRVEGRRITGIESSHGFIGAPTVVIAAGAWTSNIQSATTDFARLKIEPVLGQMVCFKTNPPFARHLLYSPRGYLVPRRDGRILAGSTSEHVGFEKRVTDEGLESIRSMAFEIAPSLGSIPIVDSWAGFRPHAPDDLPVLGPTAEVDGLVYATGHYRNGILLAPITAQLISDSLLKQDSPFSIEAFSPDRFYAVPAGA